MILTCVKLIEKYFVSINNKEYNYHYGSINVCP